MTREEIKIEFDYLKAKYENETEYNAQKNLTNLYALCRACMDAGAHESGLMVADYLLPVLTRLIEDATGLAMREVNDYILAHPEYSDWRYKLYWNVVLEETYDRFEPFMFYMERKRPFAKKFYEPRQYDKKGKPALKRVADRLQRFNDSHKKCLTISLPPRIGKSTIFMFFLGFRANRRPNAHSAYGGYSGVLAKGFFKELMNLWFGEEYCFEEIYERWNAGRKFLCDKSAEDYTINLDAPDRFSTITCRGIDGSWTGIVDISSDGILAVDDLIRDREHSMSPTRMENTWQEFLNKMVDRMNDGSQMVLIGTLWGVLDPIERLKALYADDPDYDFFDIPALDDDDESNFDYVLNGFSTAYYREMRLRLEPPEWQAKYQQRPYVREGLLFKVDELIYCDGIMRNDQIKRVYSVVDPSFGGGDNLSMPICFEDIYGKKKILSWIYDKRTIKHTVPRIVSAVGKYGICELRVEKTGAGLMLADKIREEMQKQSVFCCKVVPVSAPNRMSKEDKIIGYSDYIKNHYEFLPRLRDAEFVAETSENESYFKRDEDYNRAMDDLTMFTSEGKNNHDDAPDSLAQLAIMDEKKRNGQIEVLHIDGGLF